MPTAQIIENKAAGDTEKARRNAEYLARIDRSIKDLDEGKGVRVTIEELDAMTNA